MKIKNLEIKPFSGKDTDWAKWKIRAITNFVATGMGHILDSHKAAVADPVNNYNVFALLLGAANDGAASSKVGTFEPTRDGAFRS